MSNLTDDKNVNVNGEEEDDIFTQDEKYEREQAAMSEESDMVTCPNCKGEGITLVANDDDENERDFDTCSICGGSGELITDENVDEEEWRKLGGPPESIDED